VTTPAIVYPKGFVLKFLLEEQILKPAGGHKM